LNIKKIFFFGKKNMTGTLAGGKKRRKGKKKGHKK